MDIRILKQALTDELAKDKPDFVRCAELQGYIDAGGSPSAFKKQNTTAVPPSLPKGWHPNISDGDFPRQVDIPEGPQRIIDILKNMGWSVRLNVLKDCEEWQHDEHQPDWSQPSDIVVNSLPAQIQHNYYEVITPAPNSRRPPTNKPIRVTANTEWRSAVSLFAVSNKVNEPLEWLQSIEPQDGGNALIDTVVSGLHLSGGSDDYLRFIVELMLGSIVNRILEVGCHQRVVAVLYGEQNVGKSLWVNKILPETLEDYVVPNFKFSNKAKDMVDQMMGAVVVELSELLGKGATGIEQMKSYIGPGKDVVRLSYGRRSKHIKKTGAIIATANPNNDLPNDDSGNTRWVPVTIEGDMSTDTVPNWIRDVWPSLRHEVFAHVLAKYYAGHRWHDVPGELKGAQFEAVTHRTQIDPLVYMKVAEWLEEQKTRPSWVDDGMDGFISTAVLIHDALGLETWHPRGSVNRDLAVVMKAFGYVPAKRKLNGPRGWSKV